MRIYHYPITMLSICIPIYNFDMTQLVHELTKQAKRLDTGIEILMIDDGSEMFFKEINRKLKGLPYVVYEELEKNIGWSKIRNLLAKKAKYDYLLFLDCDSETPDNQYLNRYIQYFKGQPEAHNNETLSKETAKKEGSKKEALKKEAVIYGGRCYRKQPENAETLLHWLFGVHREVRDAETRSRHPYQSFMTNNFLTTKTVISRIPFYEHLSGYGHEDTLFGYELKKNGVPIIHIDNPLTHIGLEPADRVLIKMEQSQQNLLKINEYLGNDPEFAKTVRVLNTYHKLKKHHLIKPVNAVFRLFEKSIRRSLLGSSPKLWQLDLFKLGMIARAGSEVYPVKYEVRAI